MCTRPLIALALIGLSVASVRADVIYASHANGTLSSINPSTGVGTVIGNSGITMFDIALSAGGGLYGVDSVSRLYTINTTNATATLVGSTGVFINSLTFGPNGVLYGAGNNQVYTINTATGLATALSATIGLEISAGDMVFGPGGELYLTTAAGNLLTIDPVTGGILNSVATGNNSIFGLAFANGQLIGMSGSNVFSINTTTGALTPIGSTGIQSAVFGAASAPVPEPATMTVFGLLAVGGWVYGRKRKPIAN